MPEAPRSANPFSPRDKEALRRIRRTREAAASLLRRLSVRPVRETDIWGFLAKASLLLAGAPEGTSRVMIMFTDLGDTRSRRTRLDLRGVRVYVGGYQSGSEPAATLKRRAFWEDVLRKAGAQEVTFLDPSQSIGQLWRKEGRRP
jgi:hypothetical protein